MKKVILLTLTIILVITMVSCSSNRLPSGHADTISYDDRYNQVVLSDVEFEYVNENTIKITKRDGDIIYIDSSRLYDIEIKK